MDESKSAQRDTEDVREEAEVRPAVCRDQVDQRQMSRPPASIAHRQGSEADAERVRCEKEQLNKNVRSSPRPDEATASDQLGIGKVPKRQAMSEVDACFDEIASTYNEHDYEEAACRYRIHLGSIDDHTDGRNRRSGLEQGQR